MCCATPATRYTGPIALAFILAIRLGLIAFRPVPIPDEVPAHLVTALAQDRDGFLWIGTQGGVVRYDGYSFRTYRPDPADARSLSGAYVRTLRAARDGRVWIGTFADGLSIYDPASDRFTQLRHEPANAASLAHNRVEGLAEDADGRMWIATYGGLDRIDPRTGAIEHFHHVPGDPSSLADDRTRGILVDADGTVWVGSSGGLQQWSASTHGFARAAAVDAALGTNAFVSELFQDARGRLWIGTTDHGAIVWDRASGAVHRLDLSHFWVYGIAQASADEIWVATFGGGVDVVDAATLTVIDRLRHDPALPTTVGGDRVGAVLRDRSGVMWVGSWGQGLTRHDPSTRVFREIRYSPAQPTGLTHAAVVRAMQMRDGTVWAGTNGNGIDIFDASWQRVGGHRPNARDPHALADGSVTCLAQTADDSVWVATLDGTLHRRRRGAAGFERLTTANGLPGGPIRAMTEAAGGQLWIASANGLARLDTKTSAIAAYRHDPANERSLTSSTIESVAITGDGTVWAGSDSGLNAMNASTGEVTRVLRDASRADSLPNNWVVDLAIAGGRLWVATPSGAAVLTSWDGRTARFEAVAAHAGRAAISVESLIEDRRGGIWIGQRRRVDPASWRVDEFGPADGLDFRSFFLASRSRTAAGELLFGSPEGLLVVDPDRLPSWDFDPRVVVTALRVDGADRPASAHLDRLQLPPGTRGFEIEFASLDLSAPDRNAYRFRLDGFDRDWTTTTAPRRAVTYTNLSPGSYTLRVQGSNRARRWSGNELAVAVTVLPAFYQTMWFRLVFAIAIVALAYALVRLRVRRLEARGRLLERIVGERTAALTDAYARIEEASLTDPLTGLRNRRFLEQTIGPDLELALRHLRTNDTQGRRDHVCILIDLDRFKAVNDRLGHGAGDAVLVQAAAVLRATVRGSDYLVRWGGEEFLVVARFNDRAEAPTIAEKLRAAIAAHVFTMPGGDTLRMTCSVGYAPYPFSTENPHAISWDHVIDLADQALYEAKRSGRNRTVAASSTFSG